MKKIVKDWITLDVVSPAGTKESGELNVESGEFRNAELQMFW
jgi:hypothetical protein